MKRVNAVFLVLAAALLVPVQAQPLNCESAFTGMEQAICGDQQLSDLFDTLVSRSSESVARRIISQEASVEMKDNLARSCSASDNLQQCLLSAMTSAVGTLSAQLENQPNTDDQPMAMATSLDKLSRQLAVAQAHFASTSEPQPLVSSLLAVLNHYEQHPVESVTVVYEKRAIRAKLLRGCSDLRVRTRWNRALQSYGRACPFNLAESAG